MPATGSSSHPTSHTRGKRADGSPILQAIMGVAGRPLNAFVLRFAGSRYLPLYGVIRHRGRRSGRAYATPVVVRAMEHGFVIPLAFGEGADWFQNLRAAGGCMIRWNGREYAVVDPVVIDWPAARSAFSTVERALAPRLGVVRFVRVRHAGAGDRAGKDSGSISGQAETQADPARQ